MNLRQRLIIDRSGPAVLAIILIAIASPSPLSAQSGGDAPSDVDGAREEALPLTSGIERFKAAFESLSRGISIEGHLDMQAAPRATNAEVVSPGDLEIALARDLGKNAHLEAALVTNAEGTTLAAGFLDIHLFGGGTPGLDLPFEKSVRARIGRFDVPFGNDWQYFASKDRTELSAPLTTESLMEGGYNDVGISVLGTRGPVDYSAFVLRGAGPGNTFGGRLGISPFDGASRSDPGARALTAGLSVMRDLDRQGDARATFLALDSEAKLGGWRLRAEHVRKDARPIEKVIDRVVSAGWHVTAAFDAGAIHGIPITPFARFETMTDDRPFEANEGRRTRRITAGINSTFFSTFTLKLEHARTLDAPREVRDEEGFRRNSWLAQVVVAF